MAMNTKTSFETFLQHHDEEAWSATLAALRRYIHEVDRSSTEIWFAFYPLSLFHCLQEAEDRDQLARQLLLQGNYELKNQIDTSHHFLFGHRFWPEVKNALQQYAEQWQGLTQSSPDDPSITSLVDQILKVAGSAAKQSGAEESLLVGITAVAFMTLQQTGLAEFKQAPGVVTIDRKRRVQSAEEVLRQRTRDDGQGFFGFLKTVDKQWTVTWDENDDAAKYKIRQGQDLAWGAAGDQSRDWKAIDPRRIEGPIPVECRAASCGTCWVGVLAGAAKLSDVGAREGKKIKEFGYIDTAEPKPLIRLACQAQPEGPVSIVIPPWNGQFGKYLKARARGAEKVELNFSESADDELLSHDVQ